MQQTRSTFLDATLRLEAHHLIETMGRNGSSSGWLGLQILVILITIPLVYGDFGSLYSRVQALFGTVQGNVTQLNDKGCSANSAGPSFGGFGAPHRSSQLRYAAASYTKVKIVRGEVPAKPFLDACTDFLPLIGQLPPPFIAPNPDADAAV